MSGKAAKIRLTERQHAILQQIIRSTTAPQRLVQRARLIVLALGGMFHGAIGGAIGLRRKRVGLWRRRWKQSFDALVAIECRESQAALRRAIEDVLGDAPRSGFSGKPYDQGPHLLSHPPVNLPEPLPKIFAQLLQSLQEAGIG